MKNWPPVSFVLFSVTFILVGALTTVELACPIDNGTGVLKAALGLSVESVEAELVSVQDSFTFDECGDPVLLSDYTYAVDMLLTNETAELSQGIVSVKAFNDLELVYVDELGEPVELASPQFYVGVEIPAGATKNSEDVVSFTDLPVELLTKPHRIVVEPTRDTTDPTCDGEGKLPFARWLQVLISK